LQRASFPLVTRVMAMQVIAVRRHRTDISSAPPDHAQMSCVCYVTSIVAPDTPPTTSIEARVQC
jgi:hypothetical protein